MDSTQSQSTELEEELNFLHLTDEASLCQNLQTRILISKLWKISLFYLYGGSETQKKWLIDVLKATNSYFVEDKEERYIPNISKDDFSYIDKVEFEERSEAFFLTMQTEEGFEDNFQIVMKDLIALAVQNGKYDARYRTAIRTMAVATHTEWDKIDEFEKSLVESLAKIQTEEEERAKKRKSEQDKKNMKRAFFIGLTAVGGGAILALSAGLAAPLIGAGAVAVLGSSSAAALTGTSGVAIIASIFGAAGAGLTGFKMTKRIGKIEQFEFASLSDGQHLHVTLAVSGFCSTEDDSGFSTPWEALDNSTEQYGLVWEGKYLRLLGSSIIDFVKREAMQAAVKEILRYTALRAVLKSIAWPLTLISAANIIDNPWNVCTQRSKEAGIQLAHVMLNRHQGYRPVTLIGFSLGARVIFYCLQKMLEEKDYQGIIEDVVLMGAPVGVVKSEWEALEAVISGTLYNCYSRSDWLLKFVYRAASIQVGDVAGLGPVELSWPRVQNIDLGDIIKSHSDYSEPSTISNILELTGIKTKPIEQPSPSAERKIPNEIVKQISKCPKDLLSTTTPTLFNNKQTTVDQDLTPEEQETLERLVSCKSSPQTIPKLRTKEASNESTDIQLCKFELMSSPFKRVISLTKRMGISTKSNSSKRNELTVRCQDDEDSLCSESSMESTPNDPETQENLKQDNSLTSKAVTEIPATIKESAKLGRFRRHSTGQNVFGKIKNTLATNDTQESDNKFPDDKNRRYKEIFKSSKQAAASLFSKNVSPKHAMFPPKEVTEQDESNETVIDASDVNVDINKESKNTSFFGKIRRNIDTTVSKPFLKFSRENSLNDIDESSLDEELKHEESNGEDEIKK